MCMCLCVCVKQVVGLVAGTVIHLSHLVVFAVSCSSRQELCMLPVCLCFPLVPAVFEHRTFVLVSVIFTFSALSVPRVLI